MKAKRLASFVGKRQPRWRRGGTTCWTCLRMRAHLKEIDADIKEFALLKANGVEVDGNLEPFLMPFAAFVREQLHKKYKYPFHPGAARTHAMNCLGLDV